MRAVSLFSGCGGMDFAKRDLGVDVVLANDILPDAAATFNRYFPETDFVLGDVRQLEKLPSVELVTGGYPCQSFSMGGNRQPENDPRTFLFREFSRVVDRVAPKYFVAENVSGLKSVQDGRWLDLQLSTYNQIGGHGYNVSTRIVDARDYGVPQKRKRVFIVGVRKDLGAFYQFPAPTHAKRALAAQQGLLPWASHGDAIAHLPLHPVGEYYERPHDPEGNFSWYYLSRNRKAPWADPAFTVVANFRHITLHPASPSMRMIWSNLADGWKQKWDFSGGYEHLEADTSRPVLELPRRLSWREAATLQTFPANFEPAGKLEKKFEQIGNAVPPALMKIILQGIVSGRSLTSSPTADAVFATLPGTQFPLGFTGGK